MTQSRGESTQRRRHTQEKKPSSTCHKSARPNPASSNRQARKGVSIVRRSASRRPNRAHRATRLVAVLLREPRSAPRPRPRPGRLVHRLCMRGPATRDPATAIHTHQPMCMRQAVRHRSLQRRLVHHWLLGLLRHSSEGARLPPIKNLLSIVVVRVYRRARSCTGVRASLDAGRRQAPRARWGARLRGGRRDFAACTARLREEEFRRERGRWAVVGVLWWEQRRCDFGIWRRAGHSVVRVGKLDSLATAVKQSDRGTS